MPMQTLAMFFLVALAAGGLIWVFVYPILSGERKAEKRQESVVRSEPAARVAAASRTGPKVRREQVEETLKELEVRQKKQKNLPLAMRISQAGPELDQAPVHHHQRRRSAPCCSSLIFLVGGGVLAAAGARLRRRLRRAALAARRF